MKRRLLTATALVVAGGLVAGITMWTGGGHETRATSASLTVGDTLGVDETTMVDTAHAISLDDAAKTELCLTTISGASWDAARRTGHWDSAIDGLTLAQVISPDRAAYDVAGNALMATTVSGKRYCANPARYVGGKWELAFSALTAIRAALVANPATEGPTITLVP